MRISEKSKAELKIASTSSTLQKDMQNVSRSRSDSFLKDGRLDADAYIEFLNYFNAFINHTPKPFKPLVEKNLKL